MLVVRLAKADDEAGGAAEEPGAVGVGAVVAGVGKVEAVVARAVVAGVAPAAVDDVAMAAAGDVVAAGVKVEADCRAATFAHRASVPKEAPAHRFTCRG